MWWCLSTGKINEAGLKKRRVCVSGLGRTGALGKTQRRCGKRRKVSAKAPRWDCPVWAWQPGMSMAEERQAWGRTIDLVIKGSHLGNNAFKHTRKMLAEARPQKGLFEEGSGRTFATACCRSHFWEMHFMAAVNIQQVSMQASKFRLTLELESFIGPLDRSPQRPRFDILHVTHSSFSLDSQASRSLWHWAPLPQPALRAQCQLPPNRNTNLPNLVVSAGISLSFKYHLLSRQLYFLIIQSQYFAIFPYSPYHNHTWTYSFIY